MRPATLWAVLGAALVVAGCATPELVAPGPQDCQIRAGAALAEGTAGAGAFGGAANTSAGAVTVIGTCHERDLHVLTRTPQGSIVCQGPTSWCDTAIAQIPVSISPQAFEARVRRIIEDALVAPRPRSPTSPARFPPGQDAGGG